MTENVGQKMGQLLDHLLCPYLYVLSVYVPKSIKKLYILLPPPSLIFVAHFPVLLNCGAKLERANRWPTFWPTFSSMVTVAKSRFGVEGRIAVVFDQPGRRFLERWEAKCTH